ncbi:GAP family protein [Microbacterium paludicola]|uniref:GAP family protein n=1 Tax=Microbacterium paludicola TaxID=300019 RepID=UPI0011A82AAC|nr:GAP family protein [Microbacterium paludicola]
MGTIIGEILPFTIGIAISPVPIIVVILTLLSPRARRSGPGFLIGWMVGILVVLLVLTLLSSVLPSAQESDGPHLWQGAIRLVLGGLLLWLAVKQWRKRPRGEETPELPGWMAKVDSYGFGGGIRLGLVLSIANPKNVILTVSVAVDLGTGDLTPGRIAIVIVIFALLASSTVLIPVLAHLIAADRLKGPLSALHTWLLRENHVIMTVLLVVLGFAVIGRGIGAVWP